MYAEVTRVYGVTLSPRQDAELQKLTRLYKFQISRHFDLCNTGKHPKYMRQEPGEYEHRLEKSEKDIQATIQKITQLYTTVGVPQDTINKEEKTLYAGIKNCMP